MRNGVELDLSYAGDITETTVFPVHDKALNDNLGAVTSLVKMLGDAEENPTRSRPGGRTDTWRGTRLWKNVVAEPIASFLGSIVTHERALKVNGKLMAEYIRSAASVGEISKWTVALIGKEDGVVFDDIPELGHATLIERKGLTPYTPGRYRIRRVLNPRDEAIDLDLPEYASALSETQKAWKPDAARTATAKMPDLPSGPWIRQHRPKEHALLLIYLLDPDKTAPPLPAALKKPLVAFAVSFPATATKTTVKYRVNNVYWEQEYGATT
jgi:hypothetical protein